MNSQPDQFDLVKNRLTLHATRLARIREHMVLADIPALLIVEPNSILYATGASNMQVWSARTPARYLLIVTDHPAVLFDFKGAEHLARNLPTIGHIGSAEGLDMVSSGGDPRGAAERFAMQIEAHIRALDPTIDKIGIDRFPLYATDALRRRGFHLVDSDEVFTPARKIKLPIEIAYLEEAMRRVDLATERLENFVRPGMTESEAWGEFHYILMAKQGQYVSTRLFQSGPNTFPYFQECGDRILEPGDLLCLDTDAVGFEGYCVDYSRTFVCGDVKATDEQRRLYANAREQLETNAALLAPGIEFRELAEKAWKIPEEFQASRYYCIGHGLGMAGEFPNIPHAAPGQPYPLPGVIEPGMILCMESYVGTAKSDQGVKLEDQYLILEDRVERMSNYRFDDRLG
ncbi:M24 family metallopeptidase [Paracoccus aminophilus]|uniref:Aminopeptidase n=1 Tax=Paracoccus aminophilus JCM 7686 TaxID=1367847 RepID=S5XZH6_PARAH|nr:Xaa-Pro peptidase family protein [Paracoccus aminophilus]AGT08850.1 aminopeptidase [Paracoccus aminophilus JCM 7686]